LARQRLERRPAPAPALAPLERISPTLGEAIRRCFLRVAFMRDSRFSFLQKPTTAAALGIVAHELAESAARGRFASIELPRRADVFDQEWQAAIARERSRLEEAWPLAPVPPPERWRGYELVRTRLRGLIVENIVEEDLDALPTEARQVETWLEDAGGRLFGRADRIEISKDGSVEIVDLKSGWALPDEIKPEHRRQLLVYAFLWQAEHGIWPKRATIQRLDGSRLTIDVNPAEAEGVAHDLITALEEFNATIAHAPAAEQLASPGPEACEFCEFRAACAPFFATLGEQWGWYRRSAVGRVVRAIPVAGSVVVELEAEGANLSRGTGPVRVLGVPASCAPPEGSRVAVVNGLPARTPADVRVAWDSEMLLWS
jgi:hypothetical protein